MRHHAGGRAGGRRGGACRGRAHAPTHPHTHGKRVLHACRAHVSEPTPPRIGDGLPPSTRRHSTTSQEVHARGAHSRSSKLPSPQRASCSQHQKQGVSWTCVRCYACRRYRRLHQLPSPRRTGPPSGTKTCRRLTTWQLLSRLGEAAGASVAFAAVVPSRSFSRWYSPRRTRAARVAAMRASSKPRSARVRSWARPRRCVPARRARPSRPVAVPRWRCGCGAALRGAPLQENGPGDFTGLRGRGVTAQRPMLHRHLYGTHPSD